jgi:uncharacterized protein YggL (DUF469 family)
MVEYLIAMAKNVLKTQRKNFRSQKEFEDLLFDFNAQANECEEKDIVEKTTDELIEKELKEIIKGLEGEHIGTEKYK